MDFVPALRGHIGDWEYYVTLMKLNDVATRIHFANELHKHADLDDWIQRELSSRVKDMTRYLLNQSQRFYGAIIVAVYGGNPKFEAVHMAEHPILDDADFPFGVVLFDGSQQYFALDGQHRLASIKQAVEEDRSLASEEVTVIFVPHYETSEGLERTRRLFTALNRYARPTSSDINIILDEDDAVAILTRRLMREHPLFSEHGRVKLKGKNIGQGETAVTTLTVLYDLNQNFLTTRDRDVRAREFTQFRPTLDELDALYQEIVEIWDGIVETLPEFGSIAQGQSDAAAYRFPDDDPELGHLLLRPVGQIAASMAIRWALDQGHSLDRTLTRIRKIDWRLGATPWKGTVWRGGKMQTTKDVQQLAARLISYMTGLDEDTNDLLERYRTMLEDPDATLPAKVD